MIRTIRGQIVYCLSERVAVVMILIEEIVADDRPQIP